MTEKELIRRAIMGDKKAQKECTAKGIMLPCPFCGGKATMQQDITGRESYHVVCSNVKDMCNLIAGLPMWSESEEDALKVWNTRPAPPVGRFLLILLYHILLLKTTKFYSILVKSKDYC